jgi:hypothetical protein
MQVIRLQYGSMVMVLPARALNESNGTLRSNGVAFRDFVNAYNADSTFCGPAVDTSGGGGGDSSSLLPPGALKAYTINADSTILEGRTNGNNELQIKNATRSTIGFLVNNGSGITKFKLGIDSVWSAGSDTIKWRYTNGTISYKLITGGGGSTDTTSLSNRINLKVNISDTAAMLLPYLRKADTASLSSRINLKQNQLNGTGFVKASGTTISYDNSTYLTTISGIAAGGDLGGTYPNPTVTWANGYTTYDQRYLTSTAQNKLISGGVVVWLHDYVYNVSAATYLIDGVQYSSASTDITLSAADVTNDRIDLFVLTTSGTAIAVTGTASTPPVAPDYDANTQLQISFATVSASTTEPIITNEWIYKENTEWTTSASAGTINPASTSNPYAGTKDVEGTSVANGQYITFTSITTPAIASAQNLIFEIRSKANWGIAKKWILRFYNGTTAIGNSVTFGSSSYGFVSSATSQYQTITIPLADFGSISTATVFRITQSNTSGTVGWYLDNLQLQGGQGGGTPQTITIVGDVSGAGSNTINATVTGIKNKVVPTLSAGFFKYTGSAWSFDNSAYLSAGDTATMLSPYLRKADTSTLSNRINLKVNISDTATMLLPYLRKADTSTLSTRIDAKKDGYTNTLSSAGTLTLSTSGYYTFNGTTTTWTLPAISGNTGKEYFVKNKGSGAITIVSNAGGSDIYTTTAVTSFLIQPGNAFTIYNDSGTYTVR